MSFKRPRPLKYGRQQGQVIITNGVSQPSPLDRKALPLEQQKKITLELSSDDRELAAPDSKGAESSASDCVINLLQPIKNVDGYRLIKFTLHNRFFSVQKDLNDSIAFSGVNTVTTATVSRNLRMPEGYMTFSSDPADWVNSQIVGTPYDLNNLDYTTFGTAATQFPIDVRVVFMGLVNNYPAGPVLITSITTDRLTDRITIDWNNVVAGPVLQPIDMTVDLTARNALNVLGLSRSATGTTWTGIGPPNVDGPANVSIRSSVLNNSELIDHKGDNDAFHSVHLHIPEGDRQMDEPPVPAFVKFGAPTTISRIPVKLVEPQSGQILTSNNIEWSMNLEFFTLDSNPIS